MALPISALSAGAVPVERVGGKRDLSKGAFIYLYVYKLTCSILPALLAKCQEGEDDGKMSTRHYTY